MRTILITLDSLNRHFPAAYGGPVCMPVVDELAAAGSLFTGHFTASAPCMPARRELMTGILELRHRGWGPLEPFDQPIARLLGEAGIPSMLITDHYHYFEKGGENYHVDFTGYESIRGHEKDNWKTYPAPEVPINPLAWTHPAYERALHTFDSPADFPTARTFAAAQAWARENRDTKDFFLYIDEFDPHEPFMVPESYLKRVDHSGYAGPRFDWAGYGDWRGNEVELEHLRSRYAAKLLFLQDCLASFLATLKSADMYDDTTIILTTDHGHYLGEHGKVGKPAADNWNTLFHIPLVVKPAAGLGFPRGRRVDSLTTTPDIFSTVCELHGIRPPAGIYGRSFVPLLSGESEMTRKHVLYGYYGGQLGYCDGRYTYFKAPAADNTPLFWYSTRISTHAYRTRAMEEWFAQAPGLELGRFIDGVDYPVFRLPIPAGRPEARTYEHHLDEVLFDFQTDREQEELIDDPDLVMYYRERLRSAMGEAGFPDEHFLRLGL